MSLPEPIITLLASFQPVITNPTWQKALVLLIGTLLARGRRTITVALRQMGLEQTPHFSKYHHLLNRALWSPMQLSRCLLGLLVETFEQVGGTVEIVIDETLEQRQGLHISKRGYYYDSARSTQEHPQISSGLRWVCMTLIVTAPWTKRYWALPFLSVLATAVEIDAHLGRRHKTVPELVGQMVAVVRRWLPDIPIKLMAMELTVGLPCAKYHVTLIASLRPDACLCAPAPAPPTRSKWSPSHEREALAQIEPSAR